MESRTRPVPDRPGGLEPVVAPRAVNGHAVADPEAVLTAEQTRGLIARLARNVQAVVLGKDEAVRMCLMALLAGEHVLLEDVPGVGKTLLGKALARSISGRFSRIQFTPDLLPGDIVGTSIWNPKETRFDFDPGPIFANVILADEINRAPPRTQSALLEAMAEAQVSVDGVTYRLAQPFVVIATQNPFEFEGTYPLPESQLDRFLLRISLGYPPRAQEREILRSHRTGEPVDHLEATVSPGEVLALRSQARAIRVEETLSDYLLDLVHATRTDPEIQLGVSTRGALSLYHGAQALALIEGRDYVVPDDIKRLVVPVFGHRVVLRGLMREGARETAEAVLEALVARIPVPA